MFHTDYKPQWYLSYCVQRHQATYRFSYFCSAPDMFLKAVCSVIFFSVVLGYVWLEIGLLRHVARLSMRFLFWLHRDLSDLCRTSNETYTIGFTRSQLLCLLRESCGRATWPQQQLWIFYILVRPREREGGREGLQARNWRKTWVWSRGE